MCGIKLVENSRAEIIDENLISNNLHQGLLSCEGTSIRVLNNKFDRNLKANIAMGGKNSGHSLIAQNKIHRSIQEGIFVIDGEAEMMLIGNKLK